MNNPEAITAYTEALLSAAIRKCDRMEDAEDLVEETLLAALTFLARGGEIQDARDWLFSVMKRKYNDMLRKKYRGTVISFGDGFDLPAEEDVEDSLLCAETRKEVRRQVAYLAEQYRVIIVRHYFRGERIADLAASLGLPVGTVKSRLDFGRKQMKKGMEQMKSYEEQSYMPQYLHVCNSGSCGANMEPMTLVQDDVLAQNLLIRAYDKPVTISELSLAVGVSAAYVEPVVAKLVREELMRKTAGGKVYTDFIIYRAEDYYRYNPDKQKFCTDNIEGYLQPMRAAIEKLKETDFYSERLERFMMIDITAAAVYNAGEKHRTPQIFPDRPNGGKWIAFGTVYPDKSMRIQIPEEKRSREEWGMGGMRHCIIDRYLEGTNLVMLNYDTSLNPGGYEKFYSFGCRTFMEKEEAFLKLAYLIKNRIDPESVGYPPQLLAAIPGLCREGYLQQTDAGLNILVPCLTHAQSEVFAHEICRPCAKEITENLSDAMGDYLKAHRIPIPAHLDSVPEQKLTMPHEPPAMGFVYEAIRRGIHKRDLGYPCPETLLILD